MSASIAGADAGFQNMKQPTIVSRAAAAAAAGAGAGAALVGAAAVVTSDAPSAAAQEDDECVICLDSKSKSATLAVLKCSHSFCEGCIKGWSKQETTCPLCKQEFNDYKKITQTFSPLTASGTKRKRAQPKETVVKVKKTTQAQQYAQRFAAAGGGGGMHMLVPHNLNLIHNQMMLHIPQIMAMMGGQFQPGQVHAHFIPRPAARGPAPAATARATATATAASSEGRSANNAIVVDAAGVSSVLRRPGTGSSIAQAFRQRPNDPVPPRRPQGPPVVIDLTGDDDNEPPLPAPAASGRAHSSSSSSSSSSSASASASLSSSSSSSSAAPARASSGAARLPGPFPPRSSTAQPSTQRDQAAEINARIMHELFAMLDNGHGVFGDDDDDSDEFGGDY